MHTNEPREDPLVDMGFETRDVDYPKLRKALIYFFGFGFLCSMIGIPIYKYRFLFFNIKAPEEGGVAISRPLPKDPYPMLQGNVTSKTDIMDLRAEETKRLTTTGYMDPAQTTVHIPVDRAMSLIAERGLSAPPVPTDFSTGVPPTDVPAVSIAPASTNPTPAPIDATGQPAAPAATGASTTPPSTVPTTPPAGTPTQPGTLGQQLQKAARDNQKAK